VTHLDLLAGDLDGAADQRTGREDRADPREVEGSFFENSKTLYNLMLTLTCSLATLIAPPTSA
jgi:hypothetical protein